MRRLTNYLVLFLVLLLCGTKVMGQTDTVNFAAGKLLTKQLKTGLKQYLVYFQQPKQSKVLNLSLWTRDVRATVKNGEKYFVILQKWFSNDTSGYRKIYSVNRAADFLPVYHSEMIGSQVKAFNWYTDHIDGADSIANNKQKAFSLKFEQPCFNWNLDIETFEMLPLAAGKRFVLRFYDVGFGVPADITYAVMGDEVIKTIDNKEVDCWKLVTRGDHNKVVYTQTFWISKKGHEFLKEEDEMNGMFRYKVKLAGYAVDFIGRFN